MSSCDPMCPDVSQCFVIFHDFLRRIGSLMRLAVSWSPRRRIAALVFSGKPRPSSVCFSLLRINTVNRTKFCHLLSPRSWEARSKSYYIFETTTELYTQNILSRSGGTWCNIESLSYMQSYKQCPVCFERKNSVSSRGSRAPGFALHWNIQV